MNPKVKQLAEQAGGVVLAGSEIQKFAELIVRECAGQVTRNEALNIFEHFGLSSTSEPQRPAPLDSSYPDGDGYWK